jgi:hypothetical protein
MACTIGLDCSMAGKVIGQGQDARWGLKKKRFSRNGRLTEWQKCFYDWTRVSGTEEIGILEERQKLIERKR